MLQRTYDQEILLRLGGVQVKQHYNETEIFMVNTPMSSGKDEYLITVQYINVSYNFMRYYIKTDITTFCLIYSYCY